MGSEVSLSKAVRANLLSLQNTASMMDKTQNRLATGNKVNSALDNPSNFFTAAALNSRAADMGNLLDSMASGIQVLQAADNGITALTKNVESMQSTLRQARQDKSFQTQSFDVTDTSVIGLSGGQFGDLGVSIKLTNAVEGEKAQLSTAAAGEYLGPQSTTASATGAGARTLITTNGAFADGETFTVAGVTVTADDADTSGTVTDTELAASIQAALQGDASTVNKYTVSVGTGDNAGKIIVETVDTSATATAAEVVFQTADADVKGKTSFNYSAVSGAITVGGQTISTGATFDDFVASLEANAEAGGYAVEADEVTGDITLTNVDSGVAAPTVVGVPAYVAGVTANTTFDLDTTLAQDLTIGTTTLTLGAGATDADVIAAFEGDPDFDAAYTITSDGLGAFTVTSRTANTAGAAPAVSSTVGAQLTNDTLTAGVTEVDGLQPTVGVPGAYTEAVAAEKDVFTVSYDGKTANISISGVKGGIGSVANALDKADWREDTVAAVNAQLEAAGITNVEATFDEDGKLSIVAKDAEAKTLAIAGEDAVALFGTGTVDTGTAAVSGLNATKTVDKFVELINRDYAGKVRASNDNGKLRIENLSTQELSMGIDTNGNGAINTLKIEGNSVRANLSKQFNELRDQLDKLSDDSSFNGINLLRGDKLKITFNESGTSSIDIQAKDKNGNVRGINASNLGIDSLVAEDLDTDEAIDAFLGKLSSALTELRSQASAFGSNLSSVENRQNFTKNMINTLETGAANLTLADTNEEAANLLALQTRQQLSSSALSMASQQDQAVLQLLR